MVKRLRFIFVAIAVLAVISVVPVLAYGDETNTENTVELTDQLAMEIAQDFGDTISGVEGIAASDPVLFYEENGKPIGYFVSYKINGSPHGYVVLDSTGEGLISEFSFDEGSSSPYQGGAQTTNALSNSTSELKVVKTDPFVYAVVDAGTGYAVNSYGEDVSSESYIEAFSDERISPSSVNPTTWDKIFVTLGSGYNIVQSNFTTTTIGWTQNDYFVNGRGYACMVVAALDCAAYYDPNFDWHDWGLAYADLWGRCNTETYAFSGPYPLGQNTTQNTCNGLISYLSTRGVNLSGYVNYNPSWYDFKNTIDSWNMAIFACGINKTDGSGNVVQSGHGMSVQGYMQVNNSNGDLYLLGVHDGWNSGIRYVNFGFANYIYKEGAFFY